MTPDGYALPSVSFSSAATTEHVSGLVNGEPYEFEVAATSAAGTGAASAPSSAITPVSYLPFSSHVALIERVVGDLAGSAPTLAVISSDTLQLDLDGTDRGGIAAQLLSSATQASTLGSVTRLYRDCVSSIPDRGGYLHDVALRRKGASLDSLATACAKTTGFHKMYNGLSLKSFVEKAYTTSTSSKAKKALVAADVRRLEKHIVTKAALVLTFSELPAAKSAQAKTVDVDELWELLVHQAPTPSDVSSGVAALAHESLGSYTDDLMTTSAFRLTAS